MKTLTKYKEEVLDYTIDYTKWLSNEGSDTISTSTWVEDSGGITIDSTSNTTQKATVWLSGGSHGRTYVVENKIVTSGGRTVKRWFNIKVHEISTQPVGEDYV